MHARQPTAVTALCALLAVVLSGCTIGGPLLIGGEPAETARRHIHRAWTDHIKAAQEKDIDGILEMYSEDVIYVVPGTPPVRGLEALRAMEARGLEAGRVVAAQHSLQALRLSDDLAYEMGTVDGVVHPDGEDPQRVRFYFAAVWQLQADDVWRLLTITGQGAEAP